MRARDFRHNAWANLSGNWGNAILAMIIVSLISGALGATVVGAFLVAGPFSLGIAMFFLDLSRTKNSKLETVFSGFSSNFVSSLITALLTYIFTFLWTLLLVIPGIVKLYSYSMSMYILADNPNMSPSEAITASRKLMNGNKWRLFCLDFSFIGWYILSAFTCGILLLWVAPYQQAAHAEFYESIKYNAQEV